LGDCIADTIAGSLLGLAQVVLELGEEQLDRVQVWRVFRQKEEPGAGLSDGLADKPSVSTALTTRSRRSKE